MKKLINNKYKKFLLIIIAIEIIALCIIGLNFIKSRSENKNANLVSEDLIGVISSTSTLEYADLEEGVVLL